MPTKVFGGRWGIRIVGVGWMDISLFLFDRVERVGCRIVSREVVARKNLGPLDVNGELTSWSQSHQSSQIEAITMV